MNTVTHCELHTRFHNTKKRLKYKKKGQDADTEYSQCYLVNSGTRDLRIQYKISLIGEMKHRSAAASAHL